MPRPSPVPLVVLTICLDRESLQFEDLAVRDHNLAHGRDGWIQGVNSRTGRLRAAILRRSLAGDPLCVGLKSDVDVPQTLKAAQAAAALAAALAILRERFLWRFPETDGSCRARMRGARFRSCSRLAGMARS